MTEEEFRFGTLNERILDIVSKEKDFCFHDKLILIIVGLGIGIGSGTAMAGKKKWESEWKKFQKIEAAKNEKDRCCPSKLKIHWEQNRIQEYLDKGFSLGLYKKVRIVPWPRTNRSQKSYYLTPLGDYTFQVLQEQKRFLGLRPKSTFFQAQQEWGNFPPLGAPDERDSYLTNLIENHNLLTNRPSNGTLRYLEVKYKERILRIIYDRIKLEESHRRYSSSILEATRKEMKDIIRVSGNYNENNAFCYIVPTDEACEMLVSRHLSIFDELGIMRECLGKEILITTPERLQDASKDPWHIFKITSIDDKNGKSQKTGKDLPKIAGKYITEAGDLVDSRAELIIAPILVALGIPFQPGAMFWKLDLAPDFYLKNRRPVTIIEYWGGSTFPSWKRKNYKQRRAQKEKIYEELGWRLISIEAHEVHDVPALTARLKSLLC